MKKYIVCHDSDGTVFNTMDIKHKECIIPAIISEWGLQDIATYVVEAAEFVNLYSKYRGINRFKALIKVFDLLSNGIEVKNSESMLPQIDSLRKWVESAPRLGNDDLQEIVKETQDPILKKALDWTKAVDKYVVNKASKVQPFPFVSESLEMMATHADIMVISSESREILAREWEENGFFGYLNAIAGREAGSKKDILNNVRAMGYGADCILMIGDAPGDMEVACVNTILFYPVNLKFESDSWKRLYDEAFGRFIKGCFRGIYQDKLISKYTESLNYSVNREIYASNQHKGANLMKHRVEEIINQLIEQYPQLWVCKESIEKAFLILKKCYIEGGKVLVCGNGGSAADSEHIVGELMKGFMLKRKICSKDIEKIKALFPEDYVYLSDHLQGALPAISLVSQSAISTAFINDVAADMAFAQQVYGYAKKGDVLIGLSTSGNAKNVINAIKVAKTFEIKTIGLSGKSGGLIKGFCDVSIQVPADETYRIQEYHLPVYHAICAMLEVEFFK